MDKYDVVANEGYTPLADDEPVFALRAQDVAMPDVLEFYADRCQSLGSSDEHVDAIRQHRLDAIQWQRLNGCKVPD